jgi:pyruvate/2-oxoglutarate dehydrogenase complex dihydrolipoamide dehydrogenase (E3) component
METCFMERNVDVLVIGGGPAGIVSAVNARKYYPTRKMPYGL